MAKLPPIGKCVHCLEENVPRNWDHVFPRSWYPESTPPNTSKWIIPTCYKCNKEYGVLEQDLLIRLACCIDPGSAAASGIYKKALNSMDAARASNEVDARSRIAQRNKLLNGLLHGDEIPQDGIYPGLGERWERPKEAQVALTIPKVSLHRLAEKIVRGIIFLEDKKYIEPPYEIGFYALTDHGVAQIREILNQYGAEYARGPGIRITRVVAQEDGLSSIFEIEIWGALKMYASVMVPEK